MIVKKPKMAAYTFVAVILLAIFAVGCTFTGDKGEVEADNDIAPTVTPTEMLTPEPTETPRATVAPTAAISPEATVTPTPQVAVLQEYKEVEDALYFTTVPTMLSHSGGDYCYIYYLNQEKAVTALEKAMEHVQQGKGWKEGEESLGIYVVYQENWYCITREGALVGNGRIEAEEAKELFEVCMEAIKAAGLPEAVRPEQIKGIKKATLEYDGTSTITDAKALEKLEQWLLSSEELFGGAACWFTALLTLELESGEQVTISMATDSCGTWLSEGVFYQYASGNEEFFALFETYGEKISAGASSENVFDIQAELDAVEAAYEDMQQKLQTDASLTQLDMNMLAEKANQTIEVPLQDYSGRYVDTQGTDAIYSELKLELLEDGSYQTEIGIYRLTTFEGTAVQYGDILMFEDTEMRVKGNIQFSDGKAVFTVTESEFQYVTPGESFGFAKGE